MLPICSPFSPDQHRKQHDLSRLQLRNQPSRYYCSERTCLVSDPCSNCKGDQMLIEMNQHNAPTTSFAPPLSSIVPISPPLSRAEAPALVS